MSLYGGGLGQHNKERNGSLRTKDNHREIPFKQQRIAVWEGEKARKNGYTQICCSILTISFVRRYSILILHNKTVITRVPLNHIHLPMTS